MKKFLVSILILLFCNTLYADVNVNKCDNLKKKSAEELSKATGGLNLPFDLKLPF